MLNDIKAVMARADRRLLHDAIGAVSLMTMLVGALYLPGLI